MKTYLIAILFWFLTVTPAWADFSAQVLRITDGDTIVVRTTDYEDVKIRLYGIDTPERKQPGGSEATTFLTPLQGQTVTIIEMDIDRYSRVVALVEYNKQSINLALVQAGHAWHYARYCLVQPVCGQIKAAEIEARREKRGLWSGEPVPPWEWRKQKTR
jgi:endonuclease YncB( thermonuclease family)